MTIERPDWSTASTALVPTGPTTAEPRNDEPATVPTVAGEPAISDAEVSTWRGKVADWRDEELAEIDRIRRTEPVKYRKNYALQARERELIEMKNAADVGGLNPTLVAQWEKQGGVDANLQQARRAARVALDGLSAEDATSLQAGFDALPEGARMTVFAFLAVPAGTRPPADDAAVQTFASTEEGGQLIAEWGGRAARNVATVRARMRMILNAMTPADREQASVWFDGLLPAQAKAVYQALLR